MSEVNFFMYKECLLKFKKECIWLWWFLNWEMKRFVNVEKKSVNFLKEMCDLIINFRDYYF